MRSWTAFSTAPNTARPGTYGRPIHEMTEMVALNMGQYAHGNQPIQHAIYLYDYVGQPWKAQSRLRQVMSLLYQPTPDGLCGDEDNGQTSAWYVFSALGFYPVCPGDTTYAIGSPLFDRATLKLPGGKTFTVTRRAEWPTAGLHPGSQAQWRGLRQGLPPARGHRKGRRSRVPHDFRPGLQMGRGP